MVPSSNTARSAVDHSFMVYGTISTDMTDSVHPPASTTLSYVSSLGLLLILYCVSKDCFFADFVVMSFSNTLYATGLA